MPWYIFISGFACWVLCKQSDLCVHWQQELKHTSHAYLLDSSSHQMYEIVLTIACVIWCPVITLNHLCCRIYNRHYIFMSGLHVTPCCLYDPVCVCIGNNDWYIQPRIFLPHLNCIYAGIHACLTEIAWIIVDHPLSSENTKPFVFHDYKAYCALHVEPGCVDGLVTVYSQQELRRTIKVNFTLFNSHIWLNIHTILTEMISF